MNSTSLLLKTDGAAQPPVERKLSPDGSDRTVENVSSDVFYHKTRLDAREEKISCYKTFSKMNSAICINRCD
jgi:hypothetical protein